jgi:RNA polymerase sigma factor (sigma-70 family)
LTISLTIDKYESLSGRALVRHFQHMDSLLWQSIALLAQQDPDYLRSCCLVPIIRDVTGTSHGRRWFTRKDLKYPLTRLMELVRLWLQTEMKWLSFLQEVRSLGFYRDTLRTWVEGASVEHEPTRTHVIANHSQYLAFREEVCTAYLPLVWRAASSHGFTEDIRQDLFQIGTTGLLHATERYNAVDPDGSIHPSTFSTFASRWIRQAILMYISRKMPLIQVSHSVLEEESKISRNERESGKEDRSPRAQRIRRLSSTKDVLLVDEVEAEQESDDDPAIDLRPLPRHLRQVVILRHGLLERARCEASIAAKRQERERQFRALQETM